DDGDDGAEGGHAQIAAAPCARAARQAASPGGAHPAVDDDRSGRTTMNCDDVQSLLIDGYGSDDAGARRGAMEHLAECEPCRDAQLAAGMLRAERARSVPPPRPGA